MGRLPSIYCSGTALPMVFLRYRGMASAVKGKLYNCITPSITVKEF